jgi:hypothetical protein
VFIIVAMVWNKPSKSICEWKLKASSTLSNISNLFLWINKNNNNFSSLQQKVSLYAKWFHLILSELTSCNERNLVGK